MRTWHLQTAIFWIATSYVAAALFLGRTLRTDEPRWLAAAVHLLFAAFVVGHRRQPARRVGRHIQTARRLVVLARQPGLGIPGARPHLAVPAGRRLAGLVRDAVVAGAAAHGGDAGSASRLSRMFLYRGVGDPGVLHAGAVLRRQNQLHGGRYLALLDHPSVGRRASSSSSPPRSSR